MTSARARRREVTLQDVATAAGVSSASVSRVLSGGGNVSPDTEQRVLQAVAATGYRMLSPARSAADPRLVAIVINDLRSGLLADVVHGAERTATASELLTVVCTTSYSAERELEILDKLAARADLQAVIVVGGVKPTAEYGARIAEIEQVLEARGAALVFTGRPPVDASRPRFVVEYENEDGAYSATSYLLSRGHRRIAMLPGQMGMTTSEQRLNGYRRAMEAAGVDVDERLIVWSTTPDRSGGYQATQQLLHQSRDVTAVFAGNDEMAAGALAALRAARLRVPEDVSLIGYDDSPLAVELSPALTSVHLPHEALGTEAVRLAMRRPGPGSGFERVLLGTHLVVRDSVGPRV